MEWTGAKLNGIFKKMEMKRGKLPFRSSQNTVKQI